MPTINMLDAEINLSRLVESVESGVETEIIIARNGKPAARLVPMVSTSSGTRRLGIWEGRYPPMSLEEFNSTDDAILDLFYGKEDAERFRGNT